MATLEKIRNKSGLLVGAVGVALFAFVIGDFLKSESTYINQSKEKVVVVDGDAISIQDYRDRVDQASNAYRNNSSLKEEQSAQIRQSVFEEMVGSILLDNEAKKVGFAVGKDEIRDMIMGDNVSPNIQQIPAFQNPETGKFDRNRLLIFLQNLETTETSMLSPEQMEQFLNTKKSWLDLENNTILQKKMMKLSSLLSSSLSANALDAKAAYDENSTNIDFNYVIQSYNTIPDSTVKVSDAEIAQLYKDRMEGFKQEKAKVVDYIYVAIVPSEADINESEQRLLKVKEELATDENVAEIVNDNSDVPYIDAFVSFNQLDENQRLFVQKSKIGDIEDPTLEQNVFHLNKLLALKQAPDSIKVNLLNLPGNLDDAQLKNLTDSLINVIKTGKSFEDLAKDLTQGQSDGNIGWQTEVSLTSGIDAKFMNALFDAKVNEIFMVKSTYGPHLVQITEKTKPVEKYKLATVIINVTPSQDTYNIIYNKLSQYLSKNNNLETFKSAAPEAGYICQTNVQFFENQASISPIGSSRQVIKWAFEHSKGDISDKIFECEDFFVIAAVEGTLKEGYRSLADVSDILKRELINKKKGQLIVDKLKGQNLTSLESYAQTMNTTPREVKFMTFATPRIEGIGTEPAVNAVASLTEIGQTSAPFAGRNGVYVIQVTDKKASEKTYDENIQKQQLDMQFKYRLMSLIQGNTLLKDHAKIEDNRIRFY
jgi:peptidyl-prolyl cis-trans isomerase D